MALFNSQYFPSTEDYNLLYELAPFSFSSSNTLSNSINFFPNHVVTFKIFPNPDHLPMAFAKLGLPPSLTAGTEYVQSKWIMEKLYLAGKSIVGVMLNMMKLTSAVYHIVNPNMSMHWKDILGGLKASGVLVSFECADKNEWVERLVKSDEDGKRNLTIRLLVSNSGVVRQPFFHVRYGLSHRKPIVFLTEETTKLAPILKKVLVVNRELVAKQVG
ncbi:hypothetical protein ARMGADRAFT_1038000 [Armillaria gallica]|uniref:Uncharacterized protein n=1 Tax=Armillaria gallica TaxID=47427 RepID=A0A2H3CK00_ARMGA|nr:hypothetical protein ARMGADRAFT_1038000 [Armillaria gallica]